MNINQRGFPRSRPGRLVPWMSGIAWAILVAASPSAAQPLAPKGRLNVLRYHGDWNASTTEPNVAQSNSSASLVSASVNSPLTFNFIPIDNLADMLDGNQGPARESLANQILAGFHEASDLWRKYFRDPITINIAIDFAPVGPFNFAAALSIEETILYSDVRSALIHDVSPYSPFDATAVANLQPGPELDLVTNDTTVFGAAPRVRDNDTGLLDEHGEIANPFAINNGLLSIPRANAKALGLLPAHTVELDATIWVSDFSDWGEVPEPFDIDELWDFDRSTGVINPLSVDFVGVAAHEIGHAMGFTSGVEVVDIAIDPNGPFGPTAQSDLDPPEDPFDINFFSFVTTLDLFRYSEDSLARENQPAVGGVLDWAVGGEPAEGVTAPYFSIDGGETNVAYFSTGVYHGDGAAPSHWQFQIDQEPVGFMSPVTDFGHFMAITKLDLMAFDVIGFDPVPEPHTLVLLALAGSLVASGRRFRLHGPPVSLPL